MLRQVTVSIVIGTFLVGMYYVVDASYVQPVREDALAAALERFQPGLSVGVVLAMDEHQRAALVKSMPSDLQLLLVQEAKSRPSFVSESVGDIKKQTGSDARFAKLTQITALKGYDASGTALIIESGGSKFLRLEGFAVTPGIDQRVFLTKDGSVETGVDIGPLKASSGPQNYDATGVDTDTYNVVIIYSKTFDAYYAHARFLKSE